MIELQVDKFILSSILSVIYFQIMTAVICQQRMPDLVNKMQNGQAKEIIMALQGHPSQRYIYIHV